MVEIDGSYGEGGGQIVRSALSLSCLYGIPFHIVNIRSRRKKPGLQPQHLASVLAAAKICHADLRGVAKGSSSFTFVPGPVVPGDYVFDIGTAGSTSLVLQTLIPPLLFAGSESRVVITGGTHVPVSPPFTYLEKVFIPALRSLGIRIDLRIERYGFYPQGGGRITAAIHPSTTIKPLRALAAEPVRRISLISAVANLPRSIAERQRDAARRIIETSGAGTFPIHEEIREVPACSPGTFIHLEIVGNGVSAGFSAIGKRGKLAELVGGEAADQLVRHVATGAVVDPHLADQLVIYLSLAEGKSRFSTSCVTDHLLTNLHVTRQFATYDCQVTGRTGESGVVTVAGAGPFINRSRNRSQYTA